MYFLTEDDEHIGSADIKKNNNSQPVYNKKDLKTKMKSYGDEATDFDYKEIPKPVFDCSCLALMTIVKQKEENNYLQVFSKECKYIEEKEVIRHITEHILVKKFFLMTLMKNRLNVNIMVYY